LWTKNLDQHLSDEVLLILVDGELPRHRQRAARNHLERCWECRIRLAEIQETVRWVASAVNDRGFLSPERREAAWRRFLAQKASAGAPAGKPGFTLRRTRLVLAVAAAVLVVLGVWFSWRRAQGGALIPDARAFLARAEGVETALSRSGGGVRQVFHIEIRQLRPPGDVTRGRLELWTDVSGGRAASRWLDSGGKLRLAVWRPSPGVELVYDVTSAPVVMRSRSNEAEATGKVDFGETWSDAKQAGRALLRWLRGRGVRSVAMTSEFALFAGRPGASVRLERELASSGQELFKLTARRDSGGIRRDFILVLDPATLRVQLAILRIDAGETVMEVSVRPETTELVSHERLSETYFRPEPELTVRTVPRRKVLPDSAERPLTAHRELAAAYDPDSSAEVEAYWILHSQEACVRESPVVVRAEGRIRVEVVVASVERRDRLLEAFEASWSGPPIQVYVAVSDRVRAAEQGEEVRPGGFLDQDALRAVNTSYRHALALVRLAQRFDAENSSLLSPRAANLLEMMKQHHVRELGTALGRAQDAIFPQTGRLGCVPALGLRLSGPVAGSDWTSHVFAVFRAVDSMDDIVHELNTVQDVGSAATVCGRLNIVLQSLRQMAPQLELAVREPSKIMPGPAADASVSAPDKGVPRFAKGGSPQ